MPKEAAMFEAAQEQKQTGSNRMLVGIFVVVAAIAVAASLHDVERRQ